MAKKHRKLHEARKTNKPRNPSKKAPFSAHILELRQRLIWIAISVIGLSGLGWVIQDSLVAFLLHPAKNQQFIYTSPGGGINFLFQVCIYFGVALSIPVIVFNLLRYLEPLFRRNERQFILRCTLFSAVLAVLGMAFGYFIGLPAALHFLSNQFHNQQVEALFSVSDYLSFVTVYLAGSAIMFQLPMLMLFFNRITPLKPGKLLKQERWVILIAFIIAATITPTPDIFNQTIIAGPIIMTYQLGVILITWHNWRTKHDVVRHLAAQDSEIQAQRRQAAQAAELVSAEELLAENAPDQPEPVATAGTEDASEEVFVVPVRVGSSQS